MLCSQKQTKQQTIKLLEGLLTCYVREQYVEPTEAQQSAEVRFLVVMVLKKEKNSALNLNDIIGFTK